MLNKDDVIRLAKKAGFAHGIGCFAAVEEDIIAFAKLVAEHEREKLREAFRVVTAAEVNAAIANERERCAKFCEEQYEYYGHDHVFAAGIRALK
jgi:hypothetical protein